MKKLAIAVIALGMATSSLFAQNNTKTPIYVGHRGSAWGVENTKAAFLNGAAVYPYLECDIRLTADSVFVISHDETTNRVGGNLKVHESTLEQLQNENYLQKRNGQYYAGRITTFDEYLALCKEAGVLPLVEFKYTPGVNYDDCSMIPQVMKSIDKYGFLDSCIIITSMKPCLEYVMANYPQVTCQFLGGDKWKNSLDWILKHHIDVDLAHTGVTAEDVKMLHDKGLKVNVWTIDNPDRAKELIEMGVDFITTNKLLPPTAAKEATK